MGQILPLRQKDLPEALDYSTFGIRPDFFFPGGNICLLSAQNTYLSTEDGNPGERKSIWKRSRSSRKQCGRPWHRDGFTFWKQWICFTSWWKPQLFWQYRQDSCIRRPQSGTDSCKTGVYSHRSRQGRSGSSSSGSDRRRRSRSLSFCWTEFCRGRTADSCRG